MRPFVKSMKILEDQEFSIRPTSSDNSYILLAGKQTQQVIEGAYLELCLKVDDKYLVFMTDDIPDEDMLHIHLLSADLSVIDSATIGVMYSTGSFKNYEVKGPRQIAFNFIGGNKWRLEVLEGKVFSLPFISSPKGVARKYPFQQYFKLHSDPQPERTR
jgi:hypothetical protein